jgi:hypothetical protein
MLECGLWSRLVRPHSAAHMGKHDMKLLEVGMNFHLKESYESGGPNILNKLHKIDVSSLSGSTLNSMTERFNDHIFRGFDEKFPAEQESSYEWKEIDVHEFVKEAWSSATVVTIFGTHLLQFWPRAYDWVWEFDESVLQLLFGLPRFVILKAYALREESLLKFQEWEHDALQAYADGRVKEKDPERDPYWGLRFLRLKAKYTQDAGLSATSRAAFQMAFLWG